jgi:BMFP domain-containing protein YqiC
MAKQKHITGQIIQLAAFRKPCPDKTVTFRAEMESAETLDALLRASDNFDAAKPMTLQGARSKLQKVLATVEDLEDGDTLLPEGLVILKATISQIDDYLASLTARQDACAVAG